MIDELVLARTSPHHSMNYRSAVVYGAAREVTGSDELYSAARAIAGHVLPGERTTRPNRATPTGARR